eukprot:784503-Rhodomonas_salina.2
MPVTHYWRVCLCMSRCSKGDRGILTRAQIGNSYRIMIVAVKRKASLFIFVQLGSTTFAGIRVSNKD